MTKKLYGVPISVHTRKVIVALRLKRIPYELVPVVPVDPATLPTNWKRISPTGLVPAIDDGGFTLADSTAILAYVEREVPEPSLLPSESNSLDRDDREHKRVAQPRCRKRDREALSLSNPLQDSCVRRLASVDRDDPVFELVRQIRVGVYEDVTRVR